VQSQILNDREYYEEDADQIQNSAGSCNAEEIGDKSVLTKFRQGPHEGIKNKNYHVTEFQDKKPNLLGQLLNKSKPNNYSSAASVVLTEAPSTTATN